MDPIRSALLTATRRRHYDDGGAPAAKTEAAPAAPVQVAAAPAADTQAPGISQSDIENLYQTVAGRSSDPEGMAYWQQQAANGMTLDQMQAQFQQAAQDPLQQAKAASMVQSGAVQSFGDNPPLPPTKPLYLQNFDYSQYENPVDARYAFLSKTLNPTIAAAMMGNYGIESFNNPNQFQTRTGTATGTPLFDKNNLPMGYGSAQWGGTRLTNPNGGQNKMGLFDFADQYGYDPNSTEGQDRLAVYELTQNPEYAGTYKSLLGAGTDLNKATQILGNKYERPQNLGASLGDRQATAQMYMDYFSNPSSLSAADQAEIAQTKTAMMSDPMFQKYAADKAAAAAIAQQQQQQQQPPDTGLPLVADTAVAPVDNTVNNNIMAGVNDWQAQQIQNSLNYTDPNMFSTSMDNYLQNLTPSGGIPAGTPGAENNPGFSIQQMDTLPDWYTPEARGGAIHHALRLAHHYAVGGSEPAQPDHERLIDRLNRMLSQPSTSAESQDLTARRNEYLQDRPGLQIRGREFARGGYADGGGADSVLMQDKLNAPNQWLQFGGQDMQAPPAGLPIGQAVGTSAAYNTGEGLVDATKLANQVMAGEVDPTSDEGIQRAMNAAMVAQTGGLGGVQAKAGETVLGSGPMRRALEITNPQRITNDIGLYSHGAETAAGLQQAKAPQQFKSMLEKGGVKPAEMEGFDEAFANRPSVTREEIAQHFNEKMPQVEETVLGTPKFKDVNEMQVAHDAALERGDTAAANRISQDWESQFQGNTKFGQYTLPGGENYREVLLKEPIPTKKIETEGWTAVKDPDGYARDYLIYDKDGKLVAERAADSPEQAIQAATKDLNTGKEITSEPPKFQSSHWPDDPNVLAHLRMADRTGPNGEKILHVEEIQSDWGQKGKKEGFKVPLTPELESSANAIIENKLQRGVDFMHPSFKTKEGKVDPRAVTPSYVEFLEKNGTISPDEARTLQSWNKARGFDASGVHTAPYVTNTQAWTDLALKRALREAAEGGYDKLVWTPGAEQAKRYSLSNHVDEVQYSPGRNGTHSVEAYKGNNNVFNKPNATIKEIADTFGQEIADKIASGHGEVNRNTGYNVLSGLDLETGGKGMKGYYDKIVPNQLSKLVKKLDPEAKIGRETLSTSPITPEQLMDQRTIPDRNQVDFPSLTITPKMREAILRGQTAFKRGGVVGHALRLAHHYATGGYTPAQPDHERALDRINRMLTEKPEVDPATQDWSARRTDYLQSHPGPQIRDRSFARGGYADGGDPPDDTGQPGQSLLMQERQSVTPSSLAKAWTPPEEAIEINYGPRQREIMENYPEKLGAIMGGVPGAIAHSIQDPFELAHQAATNQLPPDYFHSDEGIGRALNAAGIVQTGAMPLAANVAKEAAQKGETMLGSAGGTLYHGSPVKDLTELNPSARGPLGPGTYATPDPINIAKRYAGEEGQVYQLPNKEMDIFRGSGHRTDAEYAGFKNDKQRLIDAVEPEMKDTVVPMIEKMWSGDGYPLYWQLRKAYGGDEGAQNLFKRAKFEGLSGQVDGPETVIFKKVPLKHEPQMSVGPAGYLPPNSPEYAANLEKFKEGSSVPQRVYHASRQDFPQFDTGMSEFGSHFGTIDQANAISRIELLPDFFPSKHSGTQTYPVYINIKNPIRLNDSGKFDPSEITTQLINKGILSWDDYNPIVRLPKEEAAQKLQSILKNNGYDGVVYLNKREGVKELRSTHFDLSDAEFKKVHPDAQDSYIIFNPEQAKSAIGNRGTFDPKSPKLNEARGGTIPFGPEAAQRAVQIAKQQAGRR